MGPNERKADIDKISQEVLEKIDCMLYTLFNSYILESQVQIRNLSSELNIYGHMISDTFELDKKHFD